jgi:hypothetical protein
MNTCLITSDTPYNYEFAAGKFYRAVDNYLTGKESPFLYNSKYKDINLLLIDRVITQVMNKEIYVKR